MSRDSTGNLGANSGRPNGSVVPKRSTLVLLALSPRPCVAGVEGVSRTPGESRRRTPLSKQRIVWVRLAPLVRSERALASFEALAELVAHGFAPRWLRKVAVRFHRHPTMGLREAPVGAAAC
ncbi:MAG: hypothetical protein AAF266_05945, partial [Planctomycetota bacterium]